MLLPSFPSRSSLEVDPDFRFRPACLLARSLASTGALARLPPIPANRVTTAVFGFVAARGRRPHLLVAICGCVPACAKTPAFVLARAFADAPAWLPLYANSRVRQQRHPRRSGYFRSQRQRARHGRIRPRGVAPAHRHRQPYAGAPRRGRCCPTPVAIGRARDVVIMTLPPLRRPCPLDKRSALRDSRSTGRPRQGRS